MLSFHCRWLGVILALVLSVQGTAQEHPTQPADAERFTDVTTNLIEAINADDQLAIQQLFNDAMQTALPAEKTGPFFHGVLSAKGELQAAGVPEVRGPAAANVRVTAQRGDWLFEITLDPSGKIAGLRVLPGDDNPGPNEEPPPTIEQTAEEETFFDLRRSDDRTTRMLADRYFGLVKLQEWTDLTGKASVLAKYKEHDPDLQWVKLHVVRGLGEDRETKVITVPVDKLSKTCQSRVRQIDTLKKKLDELSTAAGEPNDADSLDPRALASERGAPILEERGEELRPAGLDRELGGLRGETAAAAARHDRRQPATTASEFEPDPLGFAEVQLATPPPGAARESASPLTD